MQNGAKSTWFTRITRQLSFSGYSDIPPQLITRIIDESKDFREASMRCRKHVQAHHTKTQPKVDKVDSLVKSAANRREFIIDDIVWQESIETLEQILAAEPMVEKRRRIAFLIHVRSGMGVRESQRLANISWRTAVRCISNYRASGLARAIGYMGKLSILSLEQQIKLVNHSLDPGFATIREVQRYIYDETGVEISYNGARHMMLKLNIETVMVQNNHR